MRFVTSEIDIDTCNSAESAVGHLSINEQNLIVPFSNISCETGRQNFRYVDRCILVFQNTTSITWDYEKSRLFNGSQVVCHGGELVGKVGATEFWVEYCSGFVLLPDDAIFSEKLCGTETSVLTEFLVTGAAAAMSFLKSKDMA